MNDSSTTLFQLAEEHAAWRRRAGLDPFTIYVSNVLIRLKNRAHPILQLGDLTADVADEIIDHLERVQVPTNPFELGAVLIFLAWLKNRQLVEAAYRRAWEREHPAAEIIPEGSTDVEAVPLIEQADTPFEGISLRSEDNRFVFWCATHQSVDVRHIDLDLVEPYRDYLELCARQLANSGIVRKAEGIDTAVKYARRFAWNIASFVPELELARRKTWIMWRARGVGPTAHIDPFQRRVFRLDWYVLPWFARREVALDALTMADVRDFDGYARTTYGPGLAPDTLGQILRLARDFYVASVPIGRQYPLVPPVPLTKAQTLVEAARLILAGLDGPEDGASPPGSTISVLTQLAETRGKPGGSDGAFLTAKGVLASVSWTLPDIPAALANALTLWTNRAEQLGKDGRLDGWCLTDRGIALLASLGDVAWPGTPELVVSDARRELGKVLVTMFSPIFSETKQGLVLKTVVDAKRALPSEELARLVQLPLEGLGYHTNELRSQGMLWFKPMLTTSGLVQGLDLTPGLRSAVTALVTALSSVRGSRINVGLIIAKDDEWHYLEALAAGRSDRASPNEALPRNLRRAGLASGDPLTITPKGVRFVQSIMKAVQELAEHRRLMSVVQTVRILRQDGVIEILSELASAAAGGQLWINTASLSGPGWQTLLESGLSVELIQRQGRFAQLTRDGAALIESLQAFVMERVPPGLATGLLGVDHTQRELR